jgi:hypothetical protein
MASFRSWADLPPDLLCRIGDRFYLKWYASARGACTAWRCALAPPSPALLVFDDARLCYQVASLPTLRSFELTAVVFGSRYVGAATVGSRSPLKDRVRPSGERLCSSSSTPSLQS